MLRWAQPAPLSLSSATERVAGLDLLRILATVGIVWFHTEEAPCRSIGYAGLPMFLLIFFALIARQGPARSTRDFVRRRWDRLLMPWLFWSAVYGMSQLVKAACSADLGRLERLLSLQTIFVGTSLHLWYLPYAFTSGLLIHLLNRRTWRIDNRPVVFVATLTGVVILVVCTLGTRLRQYPPPWPQWEFGLAAIPLGLAIGRALTMPSRRAQVLMLSLACGVTVGTCAVLAFLRLGSPPVPYGVAILLVCLACCGLVHGSGFVATVAPWTFGIYLIHPLVMYGQRQFLAADTHYVTSIALTTCFSGLITWGLMKTPLRRFV